jgi:hypothetical protein
MKTLGNIVILALLGGIAYFLMTGQKPEGRAKEAAAAEKKKIAMIMKDVEATTTPVPREETAEEKREKEFAKMANQARFHCFGKLMQHVPNSGIVLIKGATVEIGGTAGWPGVFALLTYQDARAFADGSTFEGQGWKVGTYQYTAADGTFQMVNEFMECPPAARNSAVNPLDSKAHR